MYFESNVAGQIAVWLNSLTAIVVDRPFWSVFENGMVNLMGLYFVTTTKMV
jgi:hypothetical protein